MSVNVNVNGPDGEPLGSWITHESGEHEMMQRGEDDQFGTHGMPYTGNNPHQYHRVADPPKRKFKLWHGIVLGLITLVTMCLLLTLVVGGLTTTPPPPPVQPIATTGPAAVAAPSASTAPAAPKSVAVKGKNNQVVQIGAILNGAFTVEYAFGSFCGIAQFNKADGSDGAQFMETINDCASNADEKLSGSTIVHLKDVTMVKVDNTRGAWTLKLTPLSV
jgi:hypothetical protein